MKNTSAIPHHSVLFTNIDKYFSAFLCRHAKQSNEELELAIALLAHQSGKNHICLDLNTLAGKPLKDSAIFYEDQQRVSPESLRRVDANLIQKTCPELYSWKTALVESGIVGTPEDSFFPVILDSDNRLYLKRYWDYQSVIANSLNARLSEKTHHIDTSWLQPILDKLFPPSKEPQQDKTQWQKIAAVNALIHNFCVISGGPGTGKTYTVARLLILLLEQAASKQAPLRIALAAPTGKAALRMVESLKVAKEDLKKAHYDQSILEKIPEKAQTLHRLLKNIPNSPYFRFNAENPLPYDVVVIDEASMIDLAMMAKLIQAIPLQSHLILIGDQNQLASVEAGSVLGDICGENRVNRFSSTFIETLKSIEPIPQKYESESIDLISDCIVALQHSHRFGEKSGIKEVSDFVNQGEGAKAMAVLKSVDKKDANWQLLPSKKEMPNVLKTYLKNYKTYLDAVRNGKHEDALKAYDSFRVLCAVRSGPYGVNSLNRLIE